MDKGAASLRYIEIGMLAIIALFFSLTGIDNLIDFQSNWPFVQHVLAMDTTFPESTLRWRAINNPVLQQGAYYLISVWELLTAVVCWLACFKLFAQIKADKACFDKAKKLAFIGLFLGFLLYMFGFIVIGGEWFSMWQSSRWNGQRSAGLFLNLILFVMLFLRINTTEERSDRA